MRKLPECARCLLCAHDPHLICAVHPAGPEGDSCPDFRPVSNAESRRFEDFLGLQTGEELEDYENPFDLNPNKELWEPENASYYNGELIVQPQQYWTRKEMLELLDYHPIFTGRCPQCERLFPRSEKPPVHWDCSCGWVDDSV